MINATVKHIMNWWLTVASAIAQWFGMLKMHLRYLEWLNGIGMAGNNSVCNGHNGQSYVSGREHALQLYTHENKGT